jgi:uncharacterized protein YkwD/uncharacterized membrane protein required for colicin V production
MQIAWVDVVFIGIFLYFAFRGWTQGIIYLSASFLAFALSLFLALRYAGAVSAFLNDTFGISSKWAVFIGFFLVAFAAEALISEFLSRVLQKAPARLVQGSVSKVIGLVVSIASGVFLVGLFLFFLLLVPVRGTIKDDIRSSFIAPKILSFIEFYTGPLPNILKESAKELTKFMTVKPNSRESIELDVRVGEEDVATDYESEDQMAELVNMERQRAGAQILRVNQSMTDVARLYGKRMLLERFFSHYDVQGLDVSHRLEEAGVRFFIAGENLAYAPDLSTAYEGLMNSDGHRKNILDERFRRIGIGVIDAGVWGKMFVQVFAD